VFDVTADWVKIRNKYINSTMSTQEIAKKYGVSYTMVKEHCRKEGWVEQRKKQQEKTAVRLNQKTAEMIADKEAEQITKIRSVTDRLLDAVIKAAAEIDVTELRQKKQVKKTEDKGKGVKEEQTITKEYLERTETIVDMQRVQNITTALKNILEIDALLSGGNLEENQAFDDLMRLIGGSNAT